MIIQLTYKRTIYVLALLFVINNISTGQCKDCSSFKWCIKTLSDAGVKKIDFNHSKELDVKELYKIPYEKVSDTDIRADVEYDYVEIECHIKYYFMENDYDLHIVIEDAKHPKYVMIAESPDPECNSAKNSGFIDKFIKVREILKEFTTTKRNKKKHKNYRFVKTRTYLIKGVMYKDKKHVVNEAAPNFYEIHTILEIKPVN